VGPTYDIAFAMDAPPTKS